MQNKRIKPQMAIWFQATAVLVWLKMNLRDAWKGSTLQAPITWTGKEYIWHVHWPLPTNLWNYLGACLAILGRRKSSKLFGYKFARHLLPTLWEKQPLKIMERPSSWDPHLLEPLIFWRTSVAHPLKRSRFSNDLSVICLVSVICHRVQCPKQIKSMQSQIRCNGPADHDFAVFRCSWNREGLKGTHGRKSAGNPGSQSSQPRLSSTCASFSCPMLCSSLPLSSMHLLLLCFPSFWNSWKKTRTGNSPGWLHHQSAAWDTVSLMDVPSLTRQ